MANYLTYPCKIMRITQSHTGTTSHKPHWYKSKDYKDYPIDEGCSDAGREWFYCPCDEIKVVKIYGVGTRGTNTVWLQSTTKCISACNENVYITMQVTHPNDDDLRKLKVGQKFKRGQAMFREGTDGATGNHFHISVGKGKMTSGGWDKNSNGKWCLRTTDGCYYPYNAFFIDKSFTKVIDKKGIPFKTLPKDADKPTASVPDTSTSFLPSRGYFKFGDNSDNIGKIATFMRKNFSSYTSSLALGNLYGKNLLKSIKEFQRRTGLEADGYIGPLTLAKLKQYGFKY